VVTACRPCNQRKDNRKLEELGMRLLAVPYAPNRAEALIMANRRTLADQMAFLRARVGKTSRLRIPQ
ncbi:MAG: HNH endonuclease, partial [Gammaproteobacteria bacterium]